MNTPARPRNTRRLTAARQALRLCEAEQATRPHISIITTRAALRAAGLPPLAAGALRGRLRLTPDRDAWR